MSFLIVIDSLIKGSIEELFKKGDNMVILPGKPVPQILPEPMHPPLLIIVVLPFLPLLLDIVLDGPLNHLIMLSYLSRIQRMNVVLNVDVVLFEHF
jgi:hypothetical protein